jgi:glucosamine--fructose-6-phosphate aminotransferase (isomerizing)
VSDGRFFLDEIREQPSALRALLAAEQEIEAIGHRIAKERRLVRLVAHGSSDNAAAFGVYAFGVLAGWSAMRDSISLSVYYQAELPFDDSLVVALSQSGRTPDVVEYVDRARSRGALTLALTNDERSPLAETAELVVPLRAGVERSVAATKTYTNQLAALSLLAAHVAGRAGELVEMLHVVADLAANELPRLEQEAARIAVPFSFVSRMVVIGRGFEYATARELALKLTETCRVAADARTSTDLMHGPLAALDRLSPVWAIASDDVSLPAVETAVARARQAGALVVASGTAAERLTGVEHVLATPHVALPMLAPLLSVLPGQLFAAALARAKGLDADEPAHLSKVTLAP